MTTQAITKVTEDAALVPADVTPMDLQSALAGDLKRLTPEGRLKMYGAICQTTGLNPLTKPFDWLELQGKLVLYANKGCAEQLRKIHGVSIDIVERKVEHGCVIVRVRATASDGRHDEAVGAVPFQGNNPVNAANAMMKVETKAKRRVTLSICGLGLLDESELDTVSDTRSAPIVEALNGEQSAAARAEKLNTELTSGEKTTAVEAETIPVEEPSKPTATPQAASDAISPATEPPAATAPTQETETKAVIEGPLLDEETVRNIEIVLSEGKQTDAVKFLIDKGKLQAGAELSTLDPKAATFILKQAQRFWGMVEDHKGQSS